MTNCVAGKEKTKTEAQEKLAEASGNGTEILHWDDEKTRTTGGEGNREIQIEGVGKGQGLLGESPGCQGQHLRKGNSLAEQPESKRELIKSSQKEAKRGGRDASERCPLKGDN